MKKLYRFVAVLASVFALASANAQQVSPVDFMRMNPYQMKANPAADLPYQSVMGLVLGNVGLDFQHTTLRYDKLFDFDAEGRPVTVNLRQFANSLKENNFMGLDVNVDLFTLYKRINKGMLTFNYGVKVQGDLKYSDGLFKLLAYGNSAFVGENNPANAYMDVNAQVYHEFAAGYQMNVNEELSLGICGKLLFGLADIKTDVIEARLFTDPDSYALRLEENVALRASLPSAIALEDGTISTISQFSTSDVFGNFGLGLDLAAEYRFNDNFSAVAAVHDLGFIHWRGNNIQMKSNINDAGQFYDDGGLLFEGMDVDQLQRVFSDDWYREQFLDTLRQYFPVDLSELGAYNSMLNTSVLLRGNYNVNPSNRFSVQMHGTFYGSGFRPALTLAYNGSFFNHIDVCATYTMMKGSFENIGLGLAFNLGTFHIYATSNNVLGFFMPFNTGGLNAQVGIVFNLWQDE